MSPQEPEGYQVNLPRLFSNATFAQRLGLNEERFLQERNEEEKRKKNEENFITRTTVVLYCIVSH